MKKWVRRTAITVFTLFCVLNIIAAFHAYKFTHFYNRGLVPVKKPEQMSGLEKASVVLTGVNYSKNAITDVPAYAYETIHLKTTDGLKLEGWYMRSDSAKGTVILFHGHGGTRSGTVAEANAFHNFGYNVCMVDFRAHGNSEGNICTIGNNEVKDVKAAYDFVKLKGEANIILWGISLGAVTITKALHDYTDLTPAKVILEMPFGKLMDGVKAD